MSRSKARILLFDWIADGHHPAYARAVSEALEGLARVTVAGPDAMESAVGPSVDFVGLGAQRPTPDMSARLEPQLKEIAEQELQLMRDAVDRAVPDAFFSLYGDPVIQALGGRAHVGVPSATCIFKPFAHYPRAYRTRLSPRERKRALLFELRIADWRVRRSARAVFTLDTDAARRWRRRPGARSFWFPEPPLTRAPEVDSVEQREGCVLFGLLEHRKGVDRLARAVCSVRTGPTIVLAGSVRAGFEEYLAAEVSRMEAAGARVKLRFEVDEREGLELLAGARCAVLPYRKHLGMSRVLLEAAACGVPVVADEYGLLGHLVRSHGLGLTVDASDARALGRAIEELSGNPDAPTQYAAALASFAALFSPDSFRRAVAGPVSHALLHRA